VSKLSKAIPGQVGKVRGDAYNALIDTHNRVANGTPSGVSPAMGFTFDPSIVRMKNTTASAVARWGVLSCNGPVVPPATSAASFQQQVWLNGAAPAKNKRAFVALEPVAAGKHGFFMAPGCVVPVKIEKEEDITYKIARTSTLTSKLDAIEESDVGSDDRTVEILWHETGTGEKWALVLMPGRQSPGLTVLGPCASYTPAVELDDTDFDVVFPGGCLGPSRYGLNYRNLITGTATFIPLELEDPEAETLKFSSDTFSHACVAGSIDVYVDLEIPSLARDAVKLFVRKDSDDSLLANFRNSIFSWFAMQAGYLQFGPDAGTCACPTFPYEICLSVPTR